MKISFLIGGTQKGGTSALDSFLRQHPEIGMPEALKEVHYFDREKNFAGKPDHSTYHAYFKPMAQRRVYGEATPRYMYLEPVPYRVWSYNPEMKWIILLRNPVLRAFSAWNMEVRRQKESLSFTDAIRQEPTRSRKALPSQHKVYSYLDRGYYAHQIRRLFNIFGQENCLVLLSEDLADHHRKTLRSVFEFLSVDDTFIPAEKRVFSQPYAEEMTPEIYACLIRSFYYDIKALETLIGRDLSAWYSPCRNDAQPFLVP